MENDPLVLQTIRDMCASLSGQFQDQNNGSNVLTLFYDKTDLLKELSRYIPYPMHISFTWSDASEVDETGSIILPSDLKYEYEALSYNAEEKDRERYEQYQIIYNNIKLNFEDKLMLLSPKYENNVTSVVYDLFSKEDLKDYFKGKFKSLTNIDDIIPQIDEFLKKKKEKMLEILENVKQEYEKMKSDFENNYSDLETKKEKAIKDLKKIVNDDMNEYKSKIRENRHSLQYVSMMKWILTLVYHKSVNSMIHNSSIKFSEVKEIDESKLDNNPEYPHYKIAILTNNKPNFLFKLNLQSRTSSLRLSDTRINLNGKVIGLNKYMCLFVLPLSTYEVNVTEFDGDVVYKYYPLKFDMKSSIETDIYNSMIYACKNSNIKYEIKDDSITKSSFIGKLFEKVSNTNTNNKIESDSKDKSKNKNKTDSPQNSKDYW